jgi:DNA-binding response OmpR family regulator
MTAATPSPALPAPGPGLVLLVADPDPQVAADLADQLAARDINVTHCADGAEALLQIGLLAPDAILVAADMPTVDGPTLVSALRRGGSRTPIILGAGRGDAEAAVRALDEGASAAVGRPYRINEVLQLLNLAYVGLGDDDRPISCGPITLNPASYEVRIDGDPVYLPLREFKLLHLLMSRAERLVTREEIRARLWGTEAQRSNTITVHIRRLRERLGDDPHEPRIIQTVRGLGYRFVPPPST